MDQSFYSSEELDRMLAEMKVHQRRDVLLRIDEILTALDTTKVQPQISGKRREDPFSSLRAVSLLR